MVAQDSESSHDVQGVNVPYDPNNVCCNAPCPPGAMCNTECCDKQTEYYVQRWTCQWRQTPLRCDDDHSSDNHHRRHPECAWTKAWTCRWERIERCDVLRALCCRPPRRCPDVQGGGAYRGECECLVPEDAFFAKVYEIEYEECPPWNPEVAASGDCIQEEHDHTPVNCACCGVYEVCCPRWVKITCKNDVPPEYPFAVPLPYYERPVSSSGCRRPRGPCAGAACRVGPSANRSPDFWLRPALPFA